eukprot:SAG25_NODE_16_length_24288_cov_31.926950_8_plen_158_part_00
MGRYCHSQAAAHECVRRLDPLEEQGFLSIDEFERACRWHTPPADGEGGPNPEPEPEPGQLPAGTKGKGEGGHPGGEGSAAARQGGDPGEDDTFDTPNYWEKFNAEAECFEWYSAGEFIVQGVCAVVHMGCTPRLGVTAAVCCQIMTASVRLHVVALH